MEGGDSPLCSALAARTWSTGPSSGSPVHGHAERAQRRAGGAVGTPPGGRSQLPGRGPARPIPGVGAAAASPEAPSRSAAPRYARIATRCRAVLPARPLPEAGVFRGRGGAAPGGAGNSGAGSGGASTAEQGRAPWRWRRSARGCCAA